MTRDSDKYFIVFFPLLPFIFLLCGTRFSFEDTRYVNLGKLFHNCEAQFPLPSNGGNCSYMTYFMELYYYCDFFFFFYWAPLPLQVNLSFLILSLPTSLLKMAFMFLFSYCFSQILGEKSEIEEIVKICQCILGKGLWSRRELEMAKKFSPRYNWSNNGCGVVKHKLYLHWSFNCNKIRNHSSWIKLI